VSLSLNTVKCYMMNFDDIKKSLCLTHSFPVFIHDNGFIPNAAVKMKPNSFIDVGFTCDYIFNVIRKLKSENSVGFDSFFIAFLKKLASGVAFPVLLVWANPCFMEDSCCDTIIQEGFTLRCY